MQLIDLLPEDYESSEFRVSKDVTMSVKASKKCLTVVENGNKVYSNEESLKLLSELLLGDKSLRILVGMLTDKGNEGTIKRTIALGMAEILKIAIIRKEDSTAEIVALTLLEGKESKVVTLDILVPAERMVVYDIVKCLIQDEKELISDIVKIAYNKFGFGRNFYVKLQ